MATGKPAVVGVCTGKSRGEVLCTAFIGEGKKHKVVGMGETAFHLHAACNLTDRCVSIDLCVGGGSIIIGRLNRLSSTICLLDSAAGS